jgi:hypothetical protein
MLDGGPVFHIGGADAIILTFVVDLRSSFLIAIIVRIRLTRNSSCALSPPIIPSTNNIIMLRPCTTIANTTLLLNFRHCMPCIDPVIVPEIVEADVLLRVWNSGLLNRLHDTVASSTDAVVLVFHDRTSSQTVLSVEVTGKCWH